MSRFYNGVREIVARCELTPPVAPEAWSISSNKRGHLPADDLAPTPIERWPHIATLLENDGHITLGNIPPVNGAAIAADEHSLLATIVRRPGESLDDLLRRLDQAIGRALHEGIQTNEVEGGHFMLAAPKSSSK